MAGNGSSREQWGSRLGFILAAAGSAVGLGNIWKFPFITGMNGGAAFVLFYLISILLIGLPVMLIEISIGRKTQLNPVGAFKSISPRGPYFLIGVMGVLTAFVILSYYSVIAGWTLSYIVKAVSGNFMDFTNTAVAIDMVDSFAGSRLDIPLTEIPWTAIDSLSALGLHKDTLLATQVIPSAVLPDVAVEQLKVTWMSIDSVASMGVVRDSLAIWSVVPDTLLPMVAGMEFEAYSSSPNWPLVAHFAFITLCVLVVIKGVKSGIERWNRILMPALFVIILLLVIRGITLTGASAGLKFLFLPDFSKLTGDVMLTALGHAFFTLSLGMGAMMTYGSYLSRKENLMKSALWIVVMDTVVALLAGTAIFSAVFAMGFEPSGGPGLVFNVLPGIFAVMPGGLYVGILFFALLSIAAITSGVSLLEVVTSYFVDQKKWKRSRATLLWGLVIFLIGIPSALSYGLLKEFTLFGMNFFDFFDYMSFKYMLPLGGLFMVLFTIFRWGVGGFLAELRQGGGKLRISNELLIVLLTISAEFVLITFVAGIMGWGK